MYDIRFLDYICLWREGATLRYVGQGGGLTPLEAFSLLFNSLKKFCLFLD